MSAPEFRYVDRWRVQGRCEEVADILRDATTYPRWWGAVYLEVGIVERGDERQIGEVGLVRAKGWLPYVIEFRARVTDAYYPHGFAVQAEGELEGHGRWSIEQEGPWVDVTYDWRVLGNKPIFRYLSFLLRPLFESNHRWTMRRGEEGLRRELARRRAGAPDALLPVPPSQAPVSATLGAVAREFLDVVGVAGPGRPLRLKHTVLVRRPVEEVFAFISQPENDLAWQPEIRVVELTSDEPVRAGTTFREVRSTLGRTFDWNMRVTALEPDLFICIESTRGSVSYRGCRHVEPVEDGTRVTETSEIDLPPAMHFLRGWIERGALRAVSAAYARLQALLEGR